MVGLVDVHWKLTDLAFDPPNSARTNSGLLAEISRTSAVVWLLARASNMRPASSTSTCETRWAPILVFGSHRFSPDGLTLENRVGKADFHRSDGHRPSTDGHWKIVSFGFRSDRSSPAFGWTPECTVGRFSPAFGLTLENSESEKLGECKVRRNPSTVEPFATHTRLKRKPCFSESSMFSGRHGQAPRSMQASSQARRVVCTGPVALQRPTEGQP